MQSSVRDLHTHHVLSLKQLFRPCSYLARNISTASRHRSQQNIVAAVGSCGGSGGAVGGGGGGRGRSGSGGGGNSRYGPGEHSPDHHQRGWLKLLASATAGYVVLGLLQPQRLLWPGRRIDTSEYTVAIIIPVLNESAGILATLQQLQQLQPPVDQIIVVDGGSTDDTVRLVRKCGLAAKVLRSVAGRAAQMNMGAGAATSDVLCFLHADTIPPNDLVSIIRRELADPQTVLGGFVPSIEVPGKRLWLMSLHDFISTYYAPLLFRPLSYLRGLRALFGDQTMFCRACDFRSVGGFDPQLCIMEDTDLCVRMHMAGTTQQQQQQQRQRWWQHDQCTQPLDSNTSSSSSSSSSNSDSRQSDASTMQTLPVAALSRAGSTGSTAQFLVFTAALGSAWDSFKQPRGRVRQVLDRMSVTSGRRLAAWGNLKATYIHAVISCTWYFQNDPAKLKELYVRMYTDCFR